MVKKKKVKLCSCANHTQYLLTKTSHHKTKTAIKCFHQCQNLGETRNIYQAVIIIILFFSFFLQPGYLGLTTILLILITPINACPDSLSLNLNAGEDFHNPQLQNCQGQNYLQLHHAEATSELPGG